MKKRRLRRSAPLRTRRKTMARRTRIRSRAKMKDAEAFKRVCAEIWATRPHRCELCGRTIPEPCWHSFHHQTHRSQGGRHAIENTLLICFRCHQAKHGIVERNGDWLG